MPKPCSVVDHAQSYVPARAEVLDYALILQTAGAEKTRDSRNELICRGFIDTKFVTKRHGATVAATEEGEGRRAELLGCVTQVREAFVRAEPRHPLGKCHTRGAG